MASGDTKTEQMLDVLANGGDASQFVGCCNTKTQNYILGAIERVQGVEDEIEELKNNPDVVDIVDTYADLQSYDTQHLTENDIIRVLQDETHSDNSTYYRFTKNPDTWTFIGEISGGGSSVNVVQTTGTSTTDVMSQNATTSMVYQDPSTKNNIQIGSDASASGTGTFGKIAIGKSATTSGGGVNIAIGQNVSVSSATKGIGIGGSVPKDYCINIGGTIRNNAGTHNVAIAGEAGTSNLNYCVAIGDGSKCTRTGEVNIGASSTHGYNSSAYRILGGVYDGQLAQDAVTVNQVNSVIDAINTALSTSIPHIGA